MNNLKSHIVLNRVNIYSFLREHWQSCELFCLIQHRKFRDSVGIPEFSDILAIHSEKKNITRTITFCWHSGIHSSSSLHDILISSGITSSFSLQGGKALTLNLLGSLADNFCWLQFLVGPEKP